MNIRTTLITTGLIAANNISGTSQKCGIMNKNTLNIALAMALSGLALSANATSYNFTDLGTLGGAYSGAYGINASGQVVGESDNANYGTHATLWNAATATDLGPGVFGIRSGANSINASGQVAGLSFLAGGYDYHATVWNGTTATDLGTLGGSHSTASAINASGQVVGWSFTAANNTENHATLWNGTTATDLGGQGFSFATAINDSGLVVGYAYSDGNSYSHAMVWDGTSVTDLGAKSGAYGINASGQVVGTSVFNGQSHATLWNGTTATDLGTLGGVQSWAKAINASGQVVGSSKITGNTAFHATLWNGTTATDLNSFLNDSDVSAGWMLKDANGINDDGWIVGTAHNTLTGADHAFLMSVTSVPEPETYAMMLAGLGLVGFVAKRRKRVEA